MKWWWKLNIAYRRKVFCKTKIKNEIFIIIFLWFFNPVRYTKSLKRGNFQSVPQKCVSLMECPLYKCPLYKDFLIRVWPGKHSVRRFTVRLIEVSALWCVRLIEIPLCTSKEKRYRQKSGFFCYFMKSS